MPDEHSINPWLTEQIRLYKATHADAELRDASLDFREIFPNFESKSDAMDHFDIFISYKKVYCLTEAQLLYEKLKNRGYSVFFDTEEMRRSDFDTQISSHIENAKDVIVLIKAGSFASCKKEDYSLEDDWFCKEIRMALEKKKNIIPLRWDNSPMPRKEDLPEELNGLCKKHSPDFLPSFLNHYLDDLAKNGFLDSRPRVKTAEGNRGASDIGPEREAASGPGRKPAGERPAAVAAEGDLAGLDVKVGDLSFRMIRVDGGTLTIGATPEQGSGAEDNDLSPRDVDVKTFYMGQFPVTEGLWEEVMGNGGLLGKFAKSAGTGAAVGAGVAMFAPVIIPLAVVGIGAEAGGTLLSGKDKPYGKAEYGDAVEFIHRLSYRTGLKFALPTEEEWEYAARGGFRSKGYRYAGGDDADAVAWHLYNGFGMRHSVGQKAPNELGLFDMSGNVFEWTESQVPGSAEFVRRGGSCAVPESMCRVASRKTEAVLLSKTRVTGLRVIIRDLPESTAVHKKD